MNIGKVMSLFDGMSCGQLAINVLNWIYDEYYASEIDKYAIETYKKNYKIKDNREIENILEVNPADLPEYNFLCAGFPCQPFSLMGNKMGTEDSRSNIMYQCIKVIQKKLPKNISLAFDGQKINLSQ